jgi:hypothetical protein
MLAPSSSSTRAYLPRRSANERSASLEVGYDHGAGTDNRFRTQADALTDHGAGADMAAGTDLDGPAQQRTWGHVNIVADHAIVFDNGARIDDAAIANHCARLYNAAGQQLHALTQSREL